MNILMDPARTTQRQRLVLARLHPSDALKQGFLVIEREGQEPEVHSWTRERLAQWLLGFQLHAASSDCPQSAEILGEARVDVLVKTSEVPVFVAGMCSAA